MKKLAVMLLVMCMCLCAAGAMAFSITGLETESVSREWETNLFFQRMTALTGIETTAAAQYSDKDYAKVLAALKKGEYAADVLFKAELTRSQEIELLNSGAIIDLAPYMEENMPNLCALLEENPEWRGVITLEDGRIPSLPMINRSEREICVWINKAWLDKLGLAMPQNVNELTAALEMFKAKDPNGNYKDDEAAADLLGVYEMRWLLPYFSVIADDYNLAHDAQGKYVFAPELEGYREFVATLRDWHARGLFGKDAFTSAHNAASLESSDEDVIVSGIIVTVAPYTHVPAANSADYVPLLMAGSDGNVRWRDAFGEVWTGCMAVTAGCDDPAQALRWADALYAEEGAILAYAGVEGDEFSFGENGRWVFNVDVMRTIDDIRGDSIIYTGVTMPGITPDTFLSQVDSDIDRHVIACTAQVSAVSEQVSPAYLLGETAQARANELAAQLGALVDAGIGRFATGETELTDENWNAWLESLRDAGSGELTELFNAAIN